MIRTLKRCLAVVLISGLLMDPGTSNALASASCTSAATQVLRTAHAVFPNEAIIPYMTSSSQLVIALEHEKVHTSFQRLMSHTFLVGHRALQIDVPPEWKQQLQDAFPFLALLGLFLLIVVPMHYMDRILRKRIDRDLAQRMLRENGFPTMADYQYATLKGVNDKFVQITDGSSQEEMGVVIEETNAGILRLAIPKQTDTGEITVSEALVGPLSTMPIDLVEDSPEKRLFSAMFVHGPDRSIWPRSMQYMARERRKAANVQKILRTKPGFAEALTFKQPLRRSPTIVKSHARSTDSEPKNNEVIATSFSGFLVKYGGFRVAEIHGHAAAAKKNWPELAHRVRAVASRYKPNTLVPALNSARQKRAIAERDAAYFAAAEETVLADLAALQRYPARYFKIGSMLTAGTMVSAILFIDVIHPANDLLKWGGVGLLFVFLVGAIGYFYMAASAWYVKKMSQNQDSLSMQQARYYNFQKRWAQLRVDHRFLTTEDVWSALHVPGHSYTTVRITNGSSKGRYGIVVDIGASANLTVIVPQAAHGGLIQFRSAPVTVYRSDAIFEDPPDAARMSFDLIMGRNEMIRAAAFDFRRREAEYFLSTLDTDLARDLRAGFPRPRHPQLLRFGVAARLPTRISA